MTTIRNAKKKNVIIAVACCLVLLVGAMSAYFYDTGSDAVTATVGEVSVELTHPLYDASAADWESILPRQELTMDPTVTNNGTDDAFVFLTVKIPKMSTARNDENGNAVTKENVELFLYEISDSWYQLSHSVGLKQDTYVYVYGTGTECSRLAPEASTPVLFKDSKLTVENIQGSADAFGSEHTIDISMDAVQADWMGTVAPDVIMTRINTLKNN